MASTVRGRRYAQEGTRADFFSEDFAQKHTIRFFVSSPFRQDKDLSFLYREILVPVFNLKKEDLFCVQSFYSRGIYDITLHNNAPCEAVFSLYDVNRGLDVFRGLKVSPLFQLSSRLLTFHMFSPFITNQEIESYLYRFCEKVTFQALGTTSFGVWNGKRTYFVTFRKNEQEEGGVCRPPPTVYINRSRGYLFFTGMPPYCRTCKKYGHESEYCVRCTECPKRHEEQAKEQEMKEAVTETVNELLQKVSENLRKEVSKQSENIPQRVGKQKEKVRRVEEEKIGRGEEKRKENETLRSMAVAMEKRLERNIRNWIRWCVRRRVIPWNPAGYHVPKRRWR